MEDFVWLGTKLKYLIKITAVGFSMLTDDFNIILTRGSKSVTFEKSDLVTDGDDYYIIFDTAQFGAGELYYKITAYVPDDDFPDGLRPEVFKKRLTTIKSS